MLGRLSLVLIAAGLFLSGCGGGGGSSFRVRVVTEPPGALVSLTRPGASSGDKPRAAPFETTLNFRAEGGDWGLEASPVGEAQENHVVTRRAITRAQVEGLAVDGSARILRIPLDEKEFIELGHYELVYDPQRGWCAIWTRRRAYRQTQDPQGAVESVNFEDPGKAIRSLSIAPAGDRLAFSSLEIVHNPGRSAEELEVARKAKITLDPADDWFHTVSGARLRALVLAGTRVENLTLADAKYLDIAFTPDGQRVIFTGDRKRTSRLDLEAKLDRSQSAMEHVTTHLRDGDAFDPSVGAPENIAYCEISPRWSRLDDTEIMLKIGRSGNPSSVTRGYHPAISPDGTKIAFIHEGNLRVISSDGTTTSDLTSDAREITDRFRASLRNPRDIERFDRFERDRLFSAYSHPAWTPDGRFILYVGMKNFDTDGRPTEDIYAVSLDGTTTLQLTANRSADRWPVVTPDGKSMYFLSNRGKRWGVWKMALPPELRASR